MSTTTYLLSIFPVTGPVARFSRHLAGSGYIVAAPSSYHEFHPPDPLPYDEPGTTLGNNIKITKRLSAYDEDAALCVSHLLSLPTCTGRIGTTGMCLGGHLAYRCAATNAEHIKAAVCYFATDLHARTLSADKPDNSLDLAKDIKGELVMIFGKRDNHVPAEGRDLIRKTLHEAGVEFSWYEVAGAQHAFIRDELSKGRFDPRITGICWTMLEELFERRLKIDLGEETERPGVENVC